MAQKNKEEGPKQAPPLPVLKPGECAKITPEQRDQYSDKLPQGHELVTESDGSLTVIRH